MRQEQFENKYKESWKKYNLIIEALNKKKAIRQPDVKIEELPQRYRKICHHYAISLNRQYSPALVTYLHSLVLSGHQLIYRTRPAWLTRILLFILHIFPVSIRKNIIYIIVAASFFLIPALFSGFSCYYNHDLIYSITSHSNVSQMEYMYNPDNKKAGRSEKRGSDSDLAMFGFYIKNNIGIGFRTFAGGMIAGLGTIFFLVYNGILIGGVAGYLTKLSYINTFWPFVSGHGAFELTAVVISGAAGLMLGKAIIAPGQFTRLYALKQMAKEAVVLMTGAALMLLIAAFIEAFWSSGMQPANIKYFIAAILWIVVFSYFIFTGKAKTDES